MREYRQVGTRNAGPTATNIRQGKVAGLLGFNADWRWEDEQQVLHFSYTGCWHGRAEPPEGMERGPVGYPDDYEHRDVEREPATATARPAVRSGGAGSKPSRTPKRRRNNS